MSKEQYGGRCDAVTEPGLTERNNRETLKGPEESSYINVSTKLWVKEHMLMHILGGDKGPKSVISLLLINTWENVPPNACIQFCTKLLIHHPVFFLNTQFGAYLTSMGPDASIHPNYIKMI